MLYKLLSPIWRRVVRPLWYKLSGKEKKTLLMLFDIYEPIEQNFTFIRSSSQSITYAKDIFPQIKEAVFEYLIKLPETKVINISDVGGGCGAGSEYIRAQLQIQIAKSFPQRTVKINMTMIEQAGWYEEWCNRFYPKIIFLKDDIFFHEKIYDFLVCSAVIEHVEAPFDFIERMQNMTKEKIFIYAPYNEHPLSPDGHINKIDDEFLNVLNPQKLTFIKSKAWRFKGGMVLIILPGKA